MGYTSSGKFLCCLAFTLIFALSFVNIANALDCNIMDKEDRDNCEYIMNNHGLIKNEKEILIANLIYFNNKPDFSFIFNWNNNLILNKEGINQGIIKNAWIKIKDITPGLIENSRLYDNGNVTILNDFNYSIELPSGTQDGDCKTDYRLTSESAQLSIFINDNLIGNDKLVSFSNVNQDFTYKISLGIDTNYELDHYRTNTYCCEFSRRKCVRYCTSCDFYSRNIINDHLTLDEQKNFNYYNRIPNINFRVKDKNYDSSIIEIEAGNYTSLDINFKDSSYREFKYDYSVVLDEDNLLTGKANIKDNKESRNLIPYYDKGKLYLVVKDTSNCRIIIRNHFNEYIKDCNLEYEDFDLKISTDKLSYDNGEAIDINIEPKDKTVRLDYGAQVKETVNNAQFISDVNYNKITAEFNDQKVSMLVYVRKKDRWTLIGRLAFLSLFAFLIYDFAKKRITEAA